MKIKHEDILKEHRENNETSILVSGDWITLHLTEDGVIRLELEGTKSLLNLNTNYSTKGEYNSKDYDIIDKVYKNEYTKASKDLEKLVQKFEKDISNVVSNIKKTLDKF